MSIVNKKLSKSIFNQVEYGDCFDQEMNFIGDPVYGYVKDKDNRYLLWTIGGKLRRTRLTKYYDLKTSVENASLENTEWLCPNTSPLKRKVRTRANASVQIPADNKQKIPQLSLEDFCDPYGTKFEPIV